jgi:hypothetical protein
MELRANSRLPVRNKRGGTGQTRLELQFTGDHSAPAVGRQTEPLRWTETGETASYRAVPETEKRVIFFRQSWVGDVNLPTKLVMIVPKE